ncbi:glycosyltransferase family 31 protein [Ilyonectria destructans]|nr:glycosyltransferase family 31 protein [Ilyonectria destructans]
MVVTYKNNRFIPIAIITICVVLFFLLVNPSLEAPTAQLAKFAGHKSNKTAPSHSAETSQPAVTLPDRGGAISTDDVLLIVKTGSTTMWKRMLSHIPTSLASERIAQKNTVIYSDSSDILGSFSIIDVLANLTDEAKSAPDFETYRQIPKYIENNKYFEAAGVEGDEDGPPGGWILDKYKFLPIFQHAGLNWPDAKWYIYMEDDTYLFLPSVLKHLSSFDWRQPHYLGSYAAKSDAVFAHGGAGFALSRGAWEKSFGRNPNIVNEYHDYAVSHCCGDQVLAHVLKQNGIEFGENGGDKMFTWGFNPLNHWTFRFDASNWCRPLMSWHKVHNRDVAQFYEFEKNWDLNETLLYRDFFNNMILPSIQKPVEWWDNTAAKYEMNSFKEDGPSPSGNFDLELWKKSWESAEACEAACKGWDECMQWTFVEDLCKLDDGLVMGQGYAPAMWQRKTSLKHTSGWVPERLDRWVC